MEEFKTFLSWLCRLGTDIASVPPDLQSEGPRDDD